MRVITRNREIDKDLQRQTNAGTVYVREKHFQERYLNKRKYCDGFFYPHHEYPSICCNTLRVFAIAIVSNKAIMKGSFLMENQENILKMLFPIHT